MERRVPWGHHLTAPAAVGGLPLGELRWPARGRCGHAVARVTRGGPAGRDMLLSWVPRARGSGGSHRVGEGGHIYLISCALLPLSFCIRRKKGLSLGRGERPWATLMAAACHMSPLGLAVALGVGG